MELTTSRIQSVFTAIGLTYGSYLVGNVVILVTMVALGSIGISVSTRPPLRLVLTTILLQGVTFGGIAIAYLTVSDVGFDFVPFEIPDRREILVSIVGFVVILGLLLVSSSILSYFGLESAQNRIIGIGKQNPTVLLLLIPLSFLIVGPGEELLYRGLIQGTLRESFHPIRAIVLASALFASIHLFSLSGDGKFVYVGLVFVLAIVLGSIYEYTGNLAVPALAHGGYNAVQYASVYLATTGGM